MAGHTIDMASHSASKDLEPIEMPSAITNGHRIVNGGPKTTIVTVPTTNGVSNKIAEPKIPIVNGIAVNGVNGIHGNTPNKLRVLLVQTAQGLYPSSGGYKANYSLLRQIIANGKLDDNTYIHAAAQICYGFEHEINLFAQKAEINPATSKFTEEDYPLVGPTGKTHVFKVNTFDDDERIHNIAIRREPFEELYTHAQFHADARAYVELEADDHNQVDTTSLPARIQTVIKIFARAIEEWKPTHVIFNDALTMKLTKHYPFTHSFKRVAVIHTVEQLPFGPYCQGIDGHCLNPKVEDEMLRELDGVWSVSRSVQSYCTTYGDLDTKFFVHGSMTYMDAKTGGFPRLRHNIHKTEIGMVNPCPHKGLTILLELAKRLPEFKFVTWKSWGTNDRHRKQLEALGNVTVEDTTRDTDEIWDRIKILIAPSVWHEAWGIIVSEAQLRGIPTIASNTGGLPEAKIHLPYSLPVVMVTGEREEDDPEHYKVPDQGDCIDLWEQKLRRLMTDDDFYNGIAERTGKESHEWLKALDPRAHEKWLLNMMKPESNVKKNVKVNGLKVTKPGVAHAVSAESAEKSGVVLAQQ